MNFFDAKVAWPGWPAAPRPLVMGVLNVTPDSFSDGGRFLAPERACQQFAAMLEAGAEVIDLGAESTRPGAVPVPPDSQIDRLLPVLQWVMSAYPNASRRPCLTIDTTSWAVAEACLAAGADAVNDVSAGRFDPGMLAGVASTGCGLILMHMQGSPADMQKNPTYADIVGEVGDFFLDRIKASTAAGVDTTEDARNVWVDPGIGFGKTLEHNLALLRSLPELARRAGSARPMVLGVSRKAMIGALTGKSRPEDRLFGTAAAVGWCVTEAVRVRLPAVLRVHDVAEMRDVVQVAAALAQKP